MHINDSMDNSSLRIVMYPWFAMDHLTAFLHMSNKLAARGHEIFFLLPSAKTKEKLQQFNHHPQNLKFIPLVVTQVEGLPPGAETTSDVPVSLLHLILEAMDLTRPDVESFLQEIKPQLVFYDFQYWLPSVTKPLGIKTIRFSIITPATVAYYGLNEEATTSELVKAAPGFPSSAIKLRRHEARVLHSMIHQKDNVSGLTLCRRFAIAYPECDAIGFKACKKMDGAYCMFLEKMFKKPVILAGPVVPEPPTSILEERWTKWLNGFGAREVIYCAFGSQCILQKDQFQELLLGFELTGLPFFAALKPPVGAKTVEEARSAGFNERTRGRGVVHGGWVQQQLILAHPSVGCFVTHCGSGSLSEALVSEYQMVLLPHMADHAINARMLSGDLRVGVEVEKGDEDGLFTKEGVCRAIRMVMDEESEIGKEVRANHAKWREFLLTEGLESAYIDEFVHNLRGLL